MNGPISSLPTAAEIDPDDTPDGRYAVRHFLGKTVEEAEKLFGNTISLTFTEDLDWMGPVGFRYYVYAAILYARNDRSSGDPDFINGFAGCLQRRLESEPAELVSCASYLRDACAHILHHFDRYDADPEIYVGLHAQYEALLSAFTQLADEHTRNVA